MPALIYGAFQWPLTQPSERLLEPFHNKCCRFMTGFTISKQRNLNVRSASLRAHLGLKHYKYYTTRDLLRWLGKATKPDTPDRLPYRLMYSHVIGKRSRGQPQMEFGRYARRALMAMVDELPNDKQELFRQKDTEQDYPYIRNASKILWRKYQNWHFVARETKEWLNIVTRYLKSSATFY